MNLTKILCMALAVMLALGTLALAESDDLQSKLDAANDRIAELEAQVEKYRPVYESQIVAEYCDGGVIMLSDAKAQYDSIASMYSQYGIPVDSYASEIKQSVLNSMVQTNILDEKAKELGLDQLDEETTADLTEKAAEDLETYISYYGSYFATEGATDEENRQATIEGLKNAGYTQEVLLEERISNYISERLTDYITKDVTVSDEEVQTEYTSMVETAKENFEEDDYSYNSTRSSGSTIAWNPEGYRAVKHVLIKFSDDQASRYSDLNTTLTSLKKELSDLDKPAGTEAAAEAEVVEDEESQEVVIEADETGEEAEEAAAPARTREEIEADIGTVGASIEALYSELLPKAQEVIDAFNNGTDFDSLIAQYNEDPGMTREPTATIGYAVCAESSYWEQAFTDGTMAIAEVGQISEPVRGTNGIHIIYYMSDIPAGDVPFEDIREQVESTALENKKTTTYDDQVAAWVEESNPVYHLDRFI